MTLDATRQPDAHFFVYGTLKRGQCREKCWPYKPQHVYPAWTPGRLFDLGEYPALLPGNDKVLGEVWQFRDDQANAVLAVLDEIEVTNQPGVANLYDRIICQANLAATSDHEVSQIPAYAYRFAHPISEAQYIAPVKGDDKRYVSWPPF